MISGSWGGDYQVAITITVKKEPDKSRIEVYKQFFGEDGEKKVSDMIAKAIVSGGKRGDEDGEVQ